MSAIFQRPLCDMGRGYDFAFRPIVGEPDVGDGGACDDRPHRAELYAAATDPRSPSAVWQPFSLCPEHEAQLRKYDGRLATRGVASRFRTVASRTDATAARAGART
jgi:hypothetical protein